MKKQLSGTVVNSVTPMLANGEICVAGINRLFEYFSESSVGGVWYLGSAGEDASISHAQRLTAIEAAIDANDNRLPLVVGLGPSSFSEIQELVKEFDSEYVDFHFLPYDQKLKNNAKINYIRGLADLLTDSNLWLYHNPLRGSGFTVAEARQLKCHEKVAGLKAGGYNIAHLQGMLALHDNSFQVYGAGGKQAMVLYSMGAKAHMTSDSNMWPELHNELYTKFSEGNIEAARACQARIAELSGKMPVNDNGENCLVEKYVLSLKGICKHFCNKSYTPLTTVEMRQIEDALA